MSQGIETDQGTLEDIRGADLPDQEIAPHLVEFDGPNHDAVCGECNHKISISTGAVHPMGTELGHRKEPPRCPHRPETVDPNKPVGGSE